MTQQIDLTQRRLVDPAARQISAPGAWPAGSTGQVVYYVDPKGVVGILSVHEKSPSGGFSFRIQPGTGSSQILPNGTPYACRKIIVLAPGPNADVPNSASIYFGYAASISPQGSNTTEIPPGGAAVIEVANVNQLWFVANNGADILTGFVENDL